MIWRAGQLLAFYANLSLQLHTLTLSNLSWHISQCKQSDAIQGRHCIAQYTHEMQAPKVYHSAFSARGLEQRLTSRRAGDARSSLHRLLGASRNGKAKSCALSGRSDCASAEEGRQERKNLPMYCVQYTDIVCTTSRCATTGTLRHCATRGGTPGVDRRPRCTLNRVAQEDQTPLSIESHFIGSTAVQSSALLQHPRTTALRSSCHLLCRATTHCGAIALYPRPNSLANAAF